MHLSHPHILLHITSSGLELAELEHSFDSGRKLNAKFFRRRRKRRGAANRTDHGVIERGVVRARADLRDGQGSVGTDREIDGRSQIVRSAGETPRLLNLILHSRIVQQKFRVFKNPLAALTRPTPTPFPCRRPFASAWSPAPRY